MAMALVSCTTAGPTAGGLAPTRSTAQPEGASTGEPAQAETSVQPGVLVEPAAAVRVLLSELGGATAPTAFVLLADVDAADRVKFYLDDAYVGQDRRAPFEQAYSVASGRHRVEVRYEEPGGGQGRVEDVWFVAEGGAGDGAAPQPVAPTAAPREPAPPPAPQGPVTVFTTAELERALEAAAPGTVITLAPGRYQRERGRRFVAAADGTRTAPITLRGPRSAVLSSDGPGGDYGLHVTGDHWRVEGLTVADASKGIVLDQSVGTHLVGVEVRDIGDEGVHFRWCSSDGVLRDSYVHDTGLDSPQFGEGVYVGSANSNWDRYACTDGRDNSERVLIEGTTFEDTSAEGADLKEGTESGTLRGNTFINTGYSGQNSADSAVDVKGNGWLVEDNVVRGASGAFLDAFQTHDVYDGYGTGNTFRRNTVEGAVPGSGIGLYPAADNVVTCDNRAPGAALGLVGAGGKPLPCGS